MNAGQMDRRIRIDAGTATVDPESSGEPIVTYVPMVNVWAQVQPLRGTELFAAQQVAAKVDTRFRIRWRGDVRPERMQIVDDLERVYDVHFVQEIGRREGLEILATARGEVPA